MKLKNKSRFTFTILLAIVLFSIVAFSIKNKITTPQSNNIDKSSNSASNSTTQKPTDSIKLTSLTDNTNINSTSTPNISITPSPTLETPKTFPILYYHAVSNKIDGLSELFVSPENFEKQMDYLKKNNYDVITFDNLGELNKYKKPVIITFDDGYENNYLEAYPILKKYNFKAVIFVTTNFIDKDRFITTNQIKEMKDLIKFESHTVSHPDLTKIDASKLQSELKDPKSIIKTLTGQDTTVFAYPSGNYSQAVLKSVKENYTFAVTNQSGLYNTEGGNYEIKRVYVPRNCTINNFETRLKKGFL